MARKRISQKPRRTILVVTATEAEALYFSQMRKDCRYANMTVVWEPDYKDLANLITLAGRMRTKEQYSSVWLVFGFADLDVSVQEVKELMPHAEKKKVNLAWNNPSLPLWYLLHLQAPKGFVIQVFKKQRQNAKSVHEWSIRSSSDSLGVLFCGHK